MGDSSKKKRNLFDIEPPENSGKEEVLEAAALLKNFISKVGSMDGKSVSIEGLEGVESLENAATEPMLETVRGPKKEDEFQHYLKKAYQISEDLDGEGGPLIVPRLVSKIPGKLGPKVESIRLRYKGKASKRQLERVKRKLAERGI